MIRIVPKHEGYCSMDYGSHEIVSLDKSTITLHKINNLVFNANEIFSMHQKSGDIFINEDVFIFDLFGFQYYHTLFDKIAQYEFLRMVNPDIKVLFITNLDLPFKNIEQGHISGKIINDIIAAYDIKESDVVYLHKLNKVSIKSAWHVTQYSSGMISDLPGHSLDDIVNDLRENKDDSYVVQSASLIKNRFEKFIATDKSLPAKIYLSRADTNSDLVAAKELLDRYDLGQLKSEDDLKLFQHYVGSYGRSVEKLRENINGRLLDIENTSKVEGFFSSHGYSIVKPHNLSLFEQANLFYNATHIASFKGTGLSNTVFCKDGANVLILNQNTAYRHYYYYIAKTATQNVFQFPDRNGYADVKNFSFEEIKDEIDRLYIKFI